MLGAKPFKILGGSIHYARVPRALWRDRLEKLIALGCNTVETYVFWNAHEPYEGKYNFADELDVVSFVKLAGEMGLHVIIRTGPYACAEWDQGGLPWWLLTKPGLRVRCSNKPYLAAVEKWFRKLIPMLAKLQSTRGGPIIAWQIENEYGYFGNDRAYMKHLQTLLKKLGVDVLLFTSDGTYQDITIANGGLPGVLRTANFGSDPKTRFEVLRRHQHKGPLMCAEFWVGWFDEWRTDKHSTRPPEEAAGTLAALLELDASLIFYMFHGGTNWAFNAGGNLSERFQPYVTSYDYDALLSECGDITPKYIACREVIKSKLNPDLPIVEFAPSRKIAYGKLTLDEFVSLNDSLKSFGKPVEHATPLTMEQLGHGRGFVLYRTTINEFCRGQKLVIRDMHDWCAIRLDGRLLTTWYRNDPMPDVFLEFEGRTAMLEILVHNLARSNFGHRTQELKGIADGVYVGPKRHEERLLTHWTHTSLPLESLPRLKFKKTNGSRKPGFFRGVLNVDEAADTFVELPGWCLGCVFVNGRNIGRYWHVGPQRRLYVPGPFLKRGRNEIVVFDAVGPDANTIEFADEPKLS